LVLVLLVLRSRTLLLFLRRKNPTTVDFLLFKLLEHLSILSKCWLVGKTHLPGVRAAATV
jgi:hypothetical protein